MRLISRIWVVSALFLVKPSRFDLILVLVDSALKVSRLSPEERFGPD